MTQDEIIRMAREAGLYSGNPRTPGTGNMIIRRLEHFAALVAAHEREFWDDLILHRIKSWSEAYPLAVFPEPDFKKAHEVLTANGMTLDAISASNMRHVITQVQSMIDAAIRARSETK